MLSVNKVMSSFRVGMEGSKCSRVCLNCDEKSLTQVVAYVNQFEQISNTMEILPMAKASRPGHRFYVWQVYETRVLFTIIRLLNPLILSCH